MKAEPAKLAAMLQRDFEPDLKLIGDLRALARETYRILNLVKDRAPTAGTSFSHPS